MHYRLLCMDMDGVLFTTTNFWVELHQAYGTLDEGRVLTERYLHTNYARLVEEVVGRLWKGKPEAPYRELIASLAYTPGVEELFEYAKRHNLTTAIISASSIDAARRIQQEHGVDHCFADELVIADGQLTGEFLWPIGTGHAKKATVLTHLCTDLGITPEECLFIGDGDTDVEIARLAGYSVSFNGTPALDEVATIAVHAPSLAAVVERLPQELNTAPPRDH